MQVFNVSLTAILLLFATTAMNTGATPLVPEVDEGTSTMCPEVLWVQFKRSLSSVAVVSDLSERVASYLGDSKVEINEVYKYRLCFYAQKCS